MGLPTPNVFAGGMNFHGRFEWIPVGSMVKAVKTIIDNGSPLPSFELAGPRSHIYFDPSKLRCALVTCGGLCPGLNDISAIGFPAFGG